MCMLLSKSVLKIHPVLCGLNKMHIDSPMILLISLSSITAKFWHSTITNHCKRLHSVCEISVSLIMLWNTILLLSHFSKLSEHFFFCSWWRFRDQNALKKTTLYPKTRYSQLAARLIHNFTRYDAVVLMKTTVFILSSQLCFIVWMWLQGSQPNNFENKYGLIFEGTSHLITTIPQQFIIYVTLHFFPSFLGFPNLSPHDFYHMNTQSHTVWLHQTLWRHCSIHSRNTHSLYKCAIHPYFVFIMMINPTPRIMSMYMN